MWKIEGHLENRDGVLNISGASAVELAEKFSTPLYVMSEDRLRENYRRLNKAFQTRYKRFRLYYAIKANNNIAVVRIIRSEGGYADCSCPEELEIAKEAGFRPAQLMYTGNYQSDAQLKLGLESGAVMNLDDISHLPRLLKYGAPEILSFRINPGLGEGNFKGNVFGGKESKFGIDRRTALKAYAMAKRNGVKRFGIHMMAGSCVLRKDYFPAVTEALMEIAGEIAGKVGVKFEFVNIGGGFGVTYNPSEKELDVEGVAEAVVERFAAACDEHRLGNPYLFVEPGRYLVCDAGVLLARVCSIKRTDKTFVGVDAGMNTLLRPALYGAHHAMYVASRLNEKRKQVVNVCGQVCENTDILARDRKLAVCREGDLIAILNAGAYGYSMSSNYNNRGRPAEILVHDGVAELIRERETAGDLMAKMRVPGRLR